MNEVIQALKERRSIRHFKAEMPPKEIIEQIVEAGLYAPSSKGRQPTKILVVTDPKLRARLAEINRRVKPLPEGKDPFCGAPLVLVVLADKNVPTYLYDGSLTMGNL
ncbi:MAG: nitroreductase family protein, partial [Lachnospiraceae bacterium]|nr:nitroreductase family protein [Lachnospiraceae bacterium]